VWFPLYTANRAQAAQLAREIGLLAASQGLAAAEAKFKRALLTKAAEAVTVGDLISEAQRVALHVRPTTLRQYAQSLRWIASRVAGIDEGPERFDYKAGGSERWRETVDGIALSTITPPAVESAIAAYVKERGATPEANRTAAAFLRQARGLWSRKLIRLIRLPNIPNPFAGVVVEKGRAPKYLPTFDSEKLLAAARIELRDHDPEAWKAFLLLLAGGLRKGEADALVWSNVDESRGILRITYGKTVDSIGDVPIGEETAAEFTRLREQATGLHVLEGDDRPADPTRRTYRAEATFLRLTVWLRNHGVTDRKPLEARRKVEIVGHQQGLAVFCRDHEALMR
jgi:integrase